MCNYRFANKTIMFQEALQFKNVIIFCYNRQNTIRISRRVSHLLTQHIFQIIMNFFLMLWVFMFWTILIATSYYLMHCNLTLSYHMCLNFREKVTNPHSPKLIWLMMILKLFLNCFYLLLISIGKFVMFWNLSFLFKEDMKKENLTTYYVRW
jgi:hypothetical protein